LIGFFSVVDNGSQSCFKHSSDDRQHLWIRNTNILAGEDLGQSVYREITLIVDPTYIQAEQDGEA